MLIYYLSAIYYQQPCEVICYYFHSTAEERDLTQVKLGLIQKPDILSPNPDAFPILHHLEWWCYGNDLQN